MRYLNGSQKLGSFDKVASYGDQRWAFNYVTTGESYVNMVNMTPTLYVLEMQDKSIDDITTEVQAFINDTLS